MSITTRQTRKPALAILIAAAMGIPVASSSRVHGEMLFDRGLPTANLNLAAGTNESNVSWADTESSTTPSQYYLPGDDFTLAGSGNYQAQTIRVWLAGGPTTGLSLLGGPAGGTIGTISTSYTTTSVKYADGTTYQGQSGTFYDLYQIDFAVNLNLAGGQKYDFFVNGPWTLLTAPSTYANPFLHASNAALSGSTQQGADGAFQWLYVDGNSSTVESWYTGTGGGTTGWGPGWDKNSDANVQVFGVPEPASLALLGLGGLLLMPRRRRSH